MTRYFDVNAKGHSIKCKLYCDNPRGIGTLVLFGHGFGGHKAIPMYESLTQNIITPQDLAILQKGKNAAVGFDRKINIDPLFLEELKAADITAFDYLDYAENILILHGDKDEIIPISQVQTFADDNLIEFETIKNGDHRLCNPRLWEPRLTERSAFFFRRHEGMVPA